MLSKENIKYYALIAFISIVIFKIVDSPNKLLYNIEELVKFLSPFLIGILFALLINPIMMFFEKKFKLPRILNILISYFLIFIFLIFFARLFIPSIIKTLDTLIKEIPTYITMLENFSNKYFSNSEIFNAIIPYIQKNLNVILKELIDLFSKTSSDFILYIFSLTSLLFNIVMGMILSIYMLYDKENISLGFKKVLYSATTKKKSESIIEFFKMCHNIFYNYMIGRILDSAIIGVLAFIGLKFILKMDNVLFLSFIIFLTNIIPYFGPFLGAIPPVAMALIHGPIKGIWVLLFLLVLQQIDGNLIGPKVMGDQVGLSPLWIISAVLIGGSLFGIVGVFISVPIAAIIKSSIDRYVEKRIYTKESK